MTNTDVTLNYDDFVNGTTVNTIAENLHRITGEVINDQYYDDIYRIIDSIFNEIRPENRTFDTLYSTAMKIILKDFKQRQTPSSNSSRHTSNTSRSRSRIKTQVIPKRESKANDPETQTVTEAADQFLAAKGAIHGWPRTVTNKISTILDLNHSPGLLPNFEEFQVLLESRFRDPSSDQFSTKFKMEFTQPVNRTVGFLRNFKKLRNIISMELCELVIPNVNKEFTQSTGASTNYVLVDFDEVFGTFYTSVGRYFGKVQFPDISKSSCKSHIIIDQIKNVAINWQLAKPFHGLGGLTLRIFDSMGEPLINRQDAFEIVSIIPGATKSTVNIASNHNLLSGEFVYFSGTADQSLDLVQHEVSRINTTSFTISTIVKNTITQGYILIPSLQISATLKFIVLTEENKRTDFVPI